MTTFAARHPRLRWLGVYGRLPRLPLLVLLVPVMSAIVTYDPVVDGRWDVYLPYLIRALVAATAVWILAATRSGARALSPVVCAGLVVALPVGLHYWRLSNPAVWGAPVVRIAALSDRDGRVAPDWEVIELEGGTVVPSAGGLALRSGPRQAAAVRAQIPSKVPWPMVLRTPLGPQGWSPTDEVRWTASVTRTHAYYTVVQSGRFSVQAAGGGMLITYPNGRGDVSTASIPVDASFAPFDGQPHAWRLSAAGADIELQVDGVRVWRGARHAPLEGATIGDSRPDPEHGGAMLLVRASYGRWMTRQGQASPSPQL